MYLDLSSIFKLKYVIYRSASLDVEPLYTFRSHTGPVFCLAISKNGEHCYSGGLDNVIKVWAMPSANIDPYDSYGNKIFTVQLYKLQLYLFNNFCV